MNMVDRLLKADVVNKLAERPTKKVKMERLSKLFGFDFVITLRAIDPERYADIQKMAVDFTNGNADNVDIYQMQTQTNNYDDTQHKHVLRSPFHRFRLVYYGITFITTCFTVLHS